jgi:hypothetical protein
VICGNIARYGGRMQIEMPKYEVRNVDGGLWEDISERNFMEIMVDIFDQVTPIMTDILLGKEVITPYGIYRLKN